MELCKRYNIKMHVKDAVDWALYASIEEVHKVTKKDKKEEQNQEEDNHG